MSELFTDPTAQGFDCFQIDNVEQIHLACWERAITVSEEDDWWDGNPWPPHPYVAWETTNDATEHSVGGWVAPGELVSWEAHRE